MYLSAVFTVLARCSTQRR